MAEGNIAAGTKIYIGGAAPATFDKAGYEAVTWTEIGEVTDISGEIGATYTQPTYSTLGKRGMVKRSGQYDNGNPTVSYKYIRANTGQAALVAAAGVNTPNSIKIEMTDEDTTHVYFMALVNGAPITIGSTEDFIAATVTLGITSESDVLQEDAPV